MAKEKAVREGAAPGRALPGHPANKRVVHRVLSLFFGAAVTCVGCLQFASIRLQARAQEPSHAAVTFGPTVANKQPAPGPAPKGMAWIPGGEFSMGAQDAMDMNAVGMQATRDSRPIHRVYVDGFFMDKTDVTNAQFAAFVKATGYVTIAEKTPTAEEFPGAPPENLYAGGVVFSPPKHAVALNDHFPVVELRERRELASPDGPTKLDQRKRELPCGAGCVPGCRSLRKVGAQAFADGSGMGIRCARWCCREGRMSGEKSSGPTESGWPTRSKGIFPRRTRARMDSLDWRRWRNICRINTVFTIWRETFGNGRQIGTGPITTPCWRSKVEWRATQKAQTLRTIRPNPARRRKCIVAGRSYARISTAPATWWGRVGRAK